MKKQFTGSLKLVSAHKEGTLCSRALNDAGFYTAIIVTDRHDPYFSSAMDIPASTLRTRRQSFRDGLLNGQAMCISAAVYTYPRGGQQTNVLAIWKVPYHSKMIDHNQCQKLIRELEDKREWYLSQCSKEDFKHFMWSVDSQLPVAAIRFSCENL